MKAIREVKVKYTLVLTEKEATFLRDIMQNPICSGDLDQEHPEHAELRKAFFAALKREKS